MIAFDTETTGKDLYHGAKPFLVTTSNEAREVTWWEWDVDPLTRLPAIPQEDIDEIAELLSPNQTGEIVLHNPKFDVGAMAAIRDCFGEYWRWDVTKDTLLLSHLLHSGMAHDLTSLTLHYLGIDILPYELAVREATNEARRIARSRFPEWKIAKEGVEGMPSVKSGSSRDEDKPWKNDMWLPRAVAKALNYPSDHPWWSVTREYANADSSVTLPLYRVMEREAKRRKLWNIYLTRLKVLRISYAMESRGVTASQERLLEIRATFSQESASAARICSNIAEEVGLELTLPKSGNNKSLVAAAQTLLDRENVERDVINAGFDHGIGSSKKVHRRPQIVTNCTDGGGLALDKASIRSYLDQLDSQSKAATFFRKLLDKRRFDTGLTYMAGYERFWQPWIPAFSGAVDERTGAGWYVLHPNLNPTGTATLRWSSSNPNEQNISKQEGANLRYIFGPAPGREWWSLDAKNIELRLPAYESGEEELISLFERPDDPPYYGSTHLLNFHTVYAEIWDTVLKEVGLEKVGPTCKKRFAATYYQWCKNGGFAVQYGAVEKANGWGTADLAFHRQGAHRLLKSRLSRLESLNQSCIRHADKYGYVETIPDRSVDPERGYPVVCTRTEYGKIKPTVPLNYHIQSSAMWWTMMAMIRCQEVLDERNRELERKAPRFETDAGRRFWRYTNGYFMAMQVHDEIVFDLPKRAHPKKDPKRSNLPFVRSLAILMAKTGDDFVIPHRSGIPTPVGIEYHEDNWAEGITF